MTGLPYEAVKLRRVSGVEIVEGSWLLAATTAYRVDRVRGRTLHCTRWPLDEVPPDAVLYVWQWARR